MKTHLSKVIGVDKFLTPVSLQEKLKAFNSYAMKDGVRVARVLMGRTLSKLGSDINLTKALKNEWRMDFRRVTNVIKLDDAIALERIGAHV